MSVRTTEELLTMVRGRVADQTDDDTLAFIEDITDTLADLEERAKGDGTDWKAKYEKNDAEWRKKYKDRFFNNEPKNGSENDDDSDETEKPKTFEELFL